MQQHTVTAFDAELSDLTQAVTALGVLAQAQLDDALAALVDGKASLAERAIKRDPALDGLTIEIERKAVRIIALRQPMADDLRRPISAMKIASNLERCGDLGKSIAKRILKIGADEAAAALVAPVEQLGRLVAERLRSVLNAYAARDVGPLIAVWSQDVDVDTQYEALFNEVLECMSDRDLAAAQGAHLLFIAKNLERIGDHATNIAETIHYEITGTELSPDRVKLSDV